MPLLRSRALAAVAGAFGWTVAEYGLHRFLMHQMRGRGLASREHLAHHADVTYFSPASKKLASAAGSTAVAYPLASALAGHRWARAFTGGLLATYFAYEAHHRRIHTHPPRNRYGRWSRRNHLQHHFGAPMRNHGVTSPVWDRVFGTGAAVDVVTVPRRMAPRWLLDTDGEVRPEYAAEYRVKGPLVADTDRVARDRVDAFANVAPGD